MVTEAVVLDAIGEIFEDLADDPGEAGSLSPDARLTDLGLESISLVYLISELQQRFGLGDGLFRQLREEGRLLKDMTVDDIACALVGLSARAPA